MRTSFPGDGCIRMVNPVPFRRKTIDRRAAIAPHGGCGAPLERKRLLLLAEAWERDRPSEDASDVSNVGLERHRLWLAAFSADETPIHLAVIPIDGEWAALRYFRNIGEGAEQSVTRYLMMQALVEELSARRVRYLVDAIAPARLPNGVRHFQRMVGFRIFRVEVHDRT